MLISDIEETTKDIVVDSKNHYGTDIKPSARLNMRLYNALCAKLRYKRTTIFGR